MSPSRSWCSTCRRTVSDTGTVECGVAGHRLHPIGVPCSVDICVMDRRHTMDMGRYGFNNMVGHAAGRNSVQQEAVTKQRIEQMRSADMQKRRDQHFSAKAKDNPKRVGAIPSALLFSLKKQYGSDYLQKAKEVMEREGCWWGQS